MIIGIYLAAGESKRMGCPKLSLPLGNKKLGSYGLEAALNSEVDLVIVVKREKNLEWLNTFLNNKEYKNKLVHITCKTAYLGISETIKHGIKLALLIEAEAVVIMLADQPFMTKETINVLIKQFKKTNTNYIAIGNDQSPPQPPVLFNSNLFPTLLQLEGDKGARGIFHLVPGLIIDYKNKTLFFDIDTPEDYLQIKKFF